MVIACASYRTLTGMSRFNKLIMGGTYVRLSSIQSFASDRDPALAEELPVHRHISKKHKRVNMVHACGLNATGALGLVSGNKKNKHLSSSTYPHRIKLGDLKVTAADCGYGYTVLATSSKVACGRAHTLILTDKEGIYTFGNNAYGQCGRRVIEGEIFQGSRKIHQIPHDHFTSPVKQISCGMDHSLFLTQEGKVYSCGWGADGQTGLGHYNKTAVPEEVKGDLVGVKVKKVTSSADMSMAVCEDGFIYGWGNSEYYQLGSLTDDTQIHTPRRLPFSNLGKVIDAAAGGTICCILNENGEVWVWGYGILGKGPDLEDCRYPEKIPMTLFGQSPFNPTVKVTKVQCGMHHFAAITNTSGLFMWGKNKSGCLGIGSHRNRYFPWKVLVPGPVHNVFCGVDHTIIFSRSII